MFTHPSEIDLGADADTFYECKTRFIRCKLYGDSLIAKLDLVPTFRVLLNRQEETLCAGLFTENGTMVTCWKIANLFTPILHIHVW